MQQDRLPACLTLSRNYSLGEMNIRLLPFLFAAAMGANTAFAADSQPFTIVAFGDSTTAPRGALPVYARLLQDELVGKGRAIRVVNAGVGGNTSEMARMRFEKDVLSQKPDLAIVQFGINDAAVDVWKKPPATQPRVALARYESNLREFVSRLKSADAQVIVATPNPLRWTPKLKEMYGRPPYAPDDPDGFNLLLKDYAEATRRVAREEQAALIDIFQVFLDYGTKSGRAVDDLLLDGMHPNDKGHRLIADALKARMLALNRDLAERPFTKWIPSGPDALINPHCSDITHDAPHPVVLGPGLARLDGGAVMAVYSTPASYGSPPGTTYIACRITRDGGKTWEPEQEITRHPDCQASHASVLCTRADVIHVFYLGFKKHEWKDGNPTPAEQSDVWAIQSADGGKTWANRQRIFKGYSGATNGAFESSDGHLNVPFSHYVSNPGRLNARTAISSDGGKTWRLSNPIDIGGAGDHEGAVEPSVIQLQDGRLWMLIRTSRGLFWQSFSTNGGRAWSAAEPTSIESTHAPGHLARLSNGRLALVWNPKATGRRELHLALSDDDGRTWHPSFVVAKGSQVTYPFVMEYRPGELWIGFMDVHQGWAKGPRARHVKLEEKVILAESQP